MGYTAIPMPTGIANKIYAIAAMENTKRKVLNKRNALFKIASYILNKTQYNGLPFDEYLDISVKHFRANCGSHYLKDLKLLEENAILQVDHSYYNFPKQQKTGRCKRYKFNPELVYSDAKIIEHDFNAKQAFEDQPIIKQTVRILSRLKLSLNKKQIKDFVFQKITPQTVRKERILINEELPEASFFLKSSLKKSVLSKGVKVPSHIPQSKAKLLALAEQQGQDLILYKNHCYIEEVETFIQKKVYELRYRYIKDLLRLKYIHQRQNIICSRNATNKRLDTNLTAIFSDAIALLQLDKEALVQIDLNNSQFTILAALLEQALNLCLDNSNAPKSDASKSDAKQNTVPQPLQSILNAQITENNQVSKSAFQSKNSGFVVVDFNYLLNCILMLLSKIIVTKPNKHIFSDLQAFLNYTKNGIFYECFANLAWKDHYQHFATAFKNFTALQEAARKKRPRSIAYPSGKLAHYFLGHSRQAFSEKQVQQKAQAQAEYEQLLQLIQSIRADAKRSMFLTCFSSYRYQAKSKQLLKRYFPTLVLIIDQLKKQAIKSYQEIYKGNKELYDALPETKEGKKKPKDVGNAALAVLLQRVESAIFIDHIVAYCLDNNIPVLSKHDSILCRKSDVKTVRSIMDYFLSHFLGLNGYKLKIN